MTDDPSTGAAPANDDLVAIGRHLAHLSEMLEQASSEAPTPEAVHEIDARMTAVALRAAAIGRLVFSARTKEIAAAARGVAAAIPGIERALGDLDRVEAAVGGVTRVLTLADEAIALAGRAAV